MTFPACCFSFQDILLYLRLRHYFLFELYFNCNVLLKGICLSVFSEQKRRLKEEKKAKEKAEKLAAAAQNPASADKKKINDEDIDPNVLTFEWHTAKFKFKHYFS